ncbi:hypothetical protein BDR05DRAFT_964629, partial [Suillus weaverae]
MSNSNSASNPNAQVSRRGENNEVAPKHNLPDPYRIRVGLKTDDELLQLRRRHKTGKRLERFHRKQSDLIQSLLKPMEEHTQDAREVTIAVWASLFANFILCVLQLYAAVSSASLSLIATGIDATFDFESNVLLYWTHKKALSMDVNNMASVNLVVIVESIRAIMTREKDNGFHIQAIIAVAAVLALKFVFFLYCFALRSKSSQVQLIVYEAMTFSDEIEKIDTVRADH